MGPHSWIGVIIQPQLFGYYAKFFELMTAEHHRDGHIGSVASPADNNAPDSALFCPVTPSFATAVSQTPTLPKPKNAGCLIPTESLSFILPSRYCEVDSELLDFAWKRFGAITPGWARVQAICLPVR